MNSGIVKKIYRIKDLENIQRKINLLGSNPKFKFDAITFYSARMLTTILITIIIIFFSNIQYFIVPFISVIYYYLFYYFLITNPINKRIKKLDREALTFFEILTLTLEAGRNLENSLEITCKNVDNELSDECKKSLLEV